VNFIGRISGRRGVESLSRVRSHEVNFGKEMEGKGKIDEHIKGGTMSRGSENTKSLESHNKLPRLRKKKQEDLHRARGNVKKKELEKDRCTRLF